MYYIFYSKNIKKVDFWPILCYYLKSYFKISNKEKAN